MRRRRERSQSSDAAACAILQTGCERLLAHAAVVTFRDWALQIKRLNASEPAFR